MMLLQKEKSQKIASRVSVGDKEFELEEINTENSRRQIEIAKRARRTYDVFLMQYINNKSFQIDLGVPTTIDFCINYKTHLNGFSSYTWYQNSARKFIIQAETGYTNDVPELHLYDESSEQGKEKCNFAFKHFHNFTSDGKRDKRKLPHRSHSFFGLLYYAPNIDGIGQVHPESIKY